MSVTESWIGVIWAAFAAAILGVLVAAGTSGHVPSGILLAALVVIPLAITLVLRLRRSRRRHGALGPQHLFVARSDRTSRTNSARSSSRPLGAVNPAERRRGPDWGTVSTICVALDVRHLDWLRTNDFVTPWLDQRARPVIEIEPLVAAAVDQLFEWELQSALQVLQGAIEPFVAFYNDNTFPDPLLLGEDWRFFERDDLTIEAERSTGDELWGGRALQLHQLAAEVADAYENLISVATRDVKVRKTISIPV